MAAELDELAGDVADLINYRRTATGMDYTPAPVTLYTEITCTRRAIDRAHTEAMSKRLEAAADRWKASGLLIHPSDARDLFPDIATGGRCGTCYSNEPSITIGWPICPDEFHDGPKRRHWAAIAWRVIAILLIAAWLLSGFLFATGVIK